MTADLGTGVGGTVVASPGSPPVVAVRRGRGAGARTVGVVLIDQNGCRWQPTPDLERIAVVGGAVVAVGLLSTALRRPRVQRITMGPGGWVSFRGAARPKPRSEHRPWWAVLLGARPLGR